jgi:hypothetical protein
LAFGQISGVLKNKPLKVNPLFELELAEISRSKLGEYGIYLLSIEARIALKQN